MREKEAMWKWGSGDKEYMGHEELVWGPDFVIRSSVRKQAIGRQCMPEDIRNEGRERASEPAW